MRASFPRTSSKVASGKKSDGKVLTTTSNTSSSNALLLSIVDRSSCLACWPSLSTASVSWSILRLRSSLRAVNDRSISRRAERRSRSSA